MAPSPDVEQARAAFQEGIAFAKAERWPDALQAFERSDALHPHAITTYNIGYCERLLGHSTRARKMLAKALAEPARGAGELPADLIAATQTYLGDAERQIARVVLTITPGALAVDGRPLELFATDGPRPVLLAGTRAAGTPEVPPSLTFEVDLDPGSHVFVLTVKGGAEVVANETLSPGAQISLDLRVPAPIEAAEPPARPSPQPHVAAPAVDKPNRVPAFIAFGVGAAGLAVGTVSGLIALGYKGPVDAACASASTDSGCNPKRDAGFRAADIATVSFIAGGVAVGVGAVLFFSASGSKTRPGTAAQSTSGPEVHPVIGLGTLGLQGQF